MDICQVELLEDETLSIRIIQLFNAMFRENLKGFYCYLSSKFDKNSL